MERWAIHMHKEYFKFSCAHFLIFPDGSKERLHGHNFSVSARLTARVGANGMIGDYSVYKRLIGKTSPRLAGLRIRRKISAKAAASTPSPGLAIGCW